MTGNIILAMDLSLNSSGIAILKTNVYTVTVVEVLTINNSMMKTNEIGAKLANIYFTINDLFQAFRFNYIVRERGFYRFNNVSKKLYKVVGVVDFTLYCNHVLTCDEITPKEVRKWILRKGTGTKEDIQEGLKQFMAQSSVKYKNNDESDAIAVGVAFALKNKFIKRW